MLSSPHTMGPIDVSIADLDSSQLGSVYDEAVSVLPWRLRNPARVQTKAARVLLQAVELSPGLGQLLLQGRNVIVFLSDRGGHSHFDLFPDDFNESFVFQDPCNSCLQNGVVHCWSCLVECPLAGTTH